MSFGARRALALSISARVVVIALLGAPVGALLGAFTATPARALDVELDADASFQVYEVRAPGTSTFLTRRRLTSNLGLRLVEPLGDPAPDGRRVRLSVGLRLRLYHDFGDDCLVGRELCVRAQDRDEPATWQPLSSPSLIDLPMVWIAVDGLPLGIAARVGRQLEVDPIGFVRFDGISARVAPWSWISVEAMFGLMVRGTSLVGTPQFELQGTMRVDRGEADPSVAPWTDPGASTWVVGARVRGGPGEWLQLGASVRHAWEESGTVLTRLGLSATSQPIPLVRAEAIAVFDLLDSSSSSSGALIDALGAVELREGPWSVRASVERHVPRFDPGSIWAWFRVAPIDQARLGGSLRVSDDVELGGGLLGRRAELGDQRAEDLDAGLDAWLSAKLERIQTRITGFVWSGALGPVAGVSIDGRRQLIPELAIGAHVSVWHFDDPLQPELYGTVVSESIDGIVTITEQASIVIELMHANSRVVGNRFRLIAWLRVETWR